MRLVYIAEGNTQKAKEALSVLKESTELTAIEIKILAVLIDNDGMIVEDLVELTGYDYTTVKEILKSLKNKGLVRSNPEKPVCAEWVPIGEVA
ncbi:MAG: MarR family transcriptional regulator [Theionarchaea archaeon]|nr:MarR family transcriptional regulator [Theionarchaea archaeon]